MAFIGTDGRSYVSAAAMNTANARAASMAAQSAKVTTPTAKPTLATTQAATTPKLPQSPSASPQQTAMATAATAKGVSPSTAFTSDAAYQKYLSTASGNGPQFTKETDPNAAPWINKSAPSSVAPKTTTTTTPPVTGQTAVNPPVTATTAPVTNAPPAQPTDASGLTVDAGTKTLQDATDEYIKGQGPLEAELNAQKAEDIASIQAEYDSRKTTLEQAQATLEQLNQNRISDITGSASTQNAIAEAAYKKQQDAVDLAKKASDKAYQDMQDAQALANKRAQIREETAKGLLGGAFTSAGVADIEDVIMQGELKVRSISKDAELADQGYTNQLVSLQNDYKVDQQKIEQWKSENINKAYADLQAQVTTIMQQEDVAESDKAQQIRDVSDRYNDKIATLHADALQAKYNLAKDIVTRSDTLAAQAKVDLKAKTDEENKQRDDARTALQNLMTQLPSSTFASMTPAQKQQLETLEQKAGYPVGLTEAGLKTFKEEAADQKKLYQDANLDLKQKMIDLKAKLGDKVHYTSDAYGNVTAEIYDPVSNQMTTQSLGRIGTPTSQFTFSLDENGNVIANNKVAGTSDIAPGNSNVTGNGSVPHDAPISATVGGKNVTAQPVLMTALQKADAEMFKATGQHIQVNQSFRTADQQASLYTNYKNGTGGRAVPPGQSFHEKGLAIDVTNWQAAVPYLKKYGVVNGLAGDMGHFSMGEMNPGVFSGQGGSKGPTIPSGPITDFLGLTGMPSGTPNGTESYNADDIINQYQESVGLGTTLSKATKTWIRNNPKEAAQALQRTQGLQDVKDKKNEKSLKSKSDQFAEILSNWK